MAELGRYLYRYERGGPKRIRWVMVRELSAEEYLAVGEAISAVFNQIRGVAGYANLAQDDLDALVVKLHAMAADGSARTQPEAWPTSLEYRVVAVSAAIRMHEEYVLAAIERRHGKQSREEQVARVILNEVFDRSLAYRVIYSLRNALVHGSRGMVAAFARATLVPDGAGSERIETVIELRLSRQAVAKSDFKALVRNEVAALPEDPDLIDLCGAATRAINDVRGPLGVLVNPGLPAAVSLLRGYIDEVVPFGDLPHFHQHELGQPHRGLTMLAMTNGIAEYVLAAAD